MSLWTQLWLLLGKNILLRKRQPVTLFVEFVWPIVLLLIVAFIKRASPPVSSGPCYYQPLELPNGDFLSFMKSFVCMLDYKCYDKTRKDTNDNKFQLAPLYEIVTSGDESYLKASIILEKLKNTLIDIDDIRNERLVLKVQSGSVKMTDFLNDTTEFKRSLLQNGLSEDVADAFLNSNIKINEIYRKLNVSSKLKERDTCTPLEAFEYLRASDYFYYKSNRNNSMRSVSFQNDFSALMTDSTYLTDLLVNKRSRLLMSQMTADEQASYNLAKVLCKIPKRQLITDSEFIFKEFNVSAITNYTNKITDYFTSPDFNKTMYYLSRYFVAGQKFGSDLAVIQKFSDFNEITNVMQNGLKLLSFAEKYNVQILFAKQMIKDFAPVFADIKEFDEIETLVDFVISVNKLFKILDESFTISSFFGDSLTNTLQKKLDSDSFISKSELLSSHINFKQTLQFLIKLKFGNIHEAFCLSPKLNGLFTSDFPDYAVTNLGYQLDKYCQTEESEAYFEQLAEQIFLQLDYSEIVRKIKLGIPPKISEEFISLADKISNYNFKIFYLGSTESLSKTFNSLSAALLYLEDSLDDITKLNLKNVYSLSKSMVKIFLPTLFTQEQWTYLDIFLPMLLPVLDLKNNFETVNPTFPPYARGAFLIDNGNLNSTSIDLSSIDLNQISSNLSNVSTSERNKRSIIQLLTSTVAPKTTNIFEEYYDFTTSTLVSSLNDTNNARSFYETNNNITDFSAIDRKNILSGFNLAGLMQPKVSTDFNTGFGSTSANINPFSLLNIISMMNGGGLSSASNLISTLTPLLTLIPLDQYFPGISQEISAGLISSLPQLLKLIETFSNFHLPISQNGSNGEQIKQWKAFVTDLKSQATVLVKVLSNVGLLKPADIKIIQNILATNFESISSPDVIGKVVLGCEGLNLWGILQLGKQETRNLISSVSLLLDIADLSLNASLQLTYDDGKVFECSNNPTSDYYNLTKNLNVISTATKLRYLILNKQVPESLEVTPTLNCLKIDSVYASLSKIQIALQNDFSGIIKKKLNCFRTSIFMPYKGIIDNLRTLFDSAANNADTITLLSSQMNKFVDLVKLLSWINSIADTSNNNSGINISILDDPKQLSHLLNILPTLLKDVNTMSYSLKGMEYVQKSLQMNDISNLQNGKIMFKMLETLKTYENEIIHASQAIDLFMKKYSNLINSSSYSVIFTDIQRGIEALASLVNFFSQNINGVKINTVFSNFGKISKYLQNTYNISAYEAEQIGESRLYKNPQQIYDSYLDAKTVYCDSFKLKKYLLEDNRMYIEINDLRINNFWNKTSNFLCKINFDALSIFTDKLSSQFMLPPTIRQLLDNNSTKMRKLRQNDSLFANLNSSDFQAFNPNSMTKLNDMFQLFNGISPNFNANDLPNILGKTLCGPDFSLRLEDYGYTMKPVIINVDEQNSTNSTENKIQKKLNTVKKLSTKEICANLFNQMRTIGGPVIGNLITPLLFGKILYTPRTNATYKLIQKFNQTFRQFDQLNKVLASFSNGVNQFDDLKRLTANLTLLLDNPFYQDSIDLFLLQDTNFTINDIKSYVSMLQSVTSLSNDWKYISGIMNTVKTSFACFDTNRFIAVDNEVELEKLATKLFENATFLVGLVFENVKPTDVELPPNFSVKLRMNVNNVPETNLIRPWLWLPGPSDNLFMDLRYMRGFIQMQNLLERAIVSTINEKKSGTMTSEAYNDKEFPVVYLKQFPYPKYHREDISASYVNYFILPIVVTLMWSGNIGLAIRNLIKEKEKFIEETMKAMGLRPGINWLAWFLSTYIAMLIVSVIVSCVLKYGHIFPLTNLGLIFLSLSAFAFSAIMLSFFVASFFSKTNLASLIGILAYFVSYLPFILVMSLKYEINFGAKFAMCLSTATAFGYSSLYISWYEQQGKGLQWSQIWESPIPNDTMNYGVTIMIMFLDGFIYGFLGWYVKKVFAGQYGASQPFYFIVTPKFWKTTIFCRLFCRNSQSTDEYYDEDVNYREKKRKNKSKDKYIENEPDHLPVGISIKDLSRKFKERIVVDNLSLNFFEGQITALLGHNGAGKSTTINVLTGIYAPSNGTAYIYNRDVRFEYNQIRKYVGICPQHDILFDYMTVKEHLIFYGKLKENMGKKELKRDINEMMTKIGLTQYANENVSSLSGGLRRRLEVAIAFVSGSKTVILDEPTSGVDPYNRMKIWDIILEFRAGRTILLTTHYLEEADVLSDRIAIIHQGKLQCCGSSLFLKNRFGSGYILTIDIKQLSSPVTTNNQTKQLLIEARSKSIETITNFIAKRVNGATLTRQINNNFNFTLPYSQKTNFEDFFNALEKNKNSLEIASYGISDTTLEEIFLLLTTRDENGDLLTPLNNKVVETVSTLPITHNLSTSFESDRDSGVAIELSSCDSNKSSPTPRYCSPQILSPSTALNTSIDSFSQSPSPTYSMTTQYTKLKGKELYMQQFIALILKRFHHYRRNLRILFTNIFLPCIFVALSMAFTTIRPKLTNQISLELTPSIYTPRNNLFMTFDQTQNSYLKLINNEYIRAFNSVCSNYHPNQYSEDISPVTDSSLSKQALSSYLCDLVSTDKCSLIYQYSYGTMPKQSTIFDSLNLFPTAPNCSVEPFLIETHLDNINTRIGGLSYADNLIKDKMYANQSKIIVWFENQALHSAPSFLHEFYSTYTKCTQTGACNLIANDQQPAQTKPYRIYNHPISLSDERISYDSIVQKIADIGISLTILCAYSFIPAGFVVYIVREKITQEKRLQYVCGIKPFLYWFSSFIWDFVYYMIIIGITIGVISSFGETAYTANAKNFGSLILLLVLFAWSSLPMSYMMSRFFNDAGSAYMMVFCFTLFSGIASCVAVFLLGFIQDSSPAIKMTYKVLEKLCHIFPSYSLGSGLIEITKNQLFADAYAVFGVNDVYKNPFSLDMLGQKYLSLIVTGIVFFLVVAIMESRFTIFPCCKSRIPSDKDGKMEDTDVSQERSRIQNNEANSDILVVKNLTKKYRKATGNRVCAVNNVCFSIPLGHCFGLLGINGAGKTTTFKMITDEIKPTLGNRLFNNMTMKEFLKDNIIGYCPQFDAVDELLTGKEALYIYSKLIGLTDVNTAMLTAITRFKLQSFIDVPIIKYSGGMKRTLSVAVAMLGNPQIVLLDEPTNGMDPEMRRRVWDNILKLIKEDRSVLLTSHSMAECDALCSRLAIMVSGQFMCLGTTQHLKHRFGGGYTLQIKVSKDSAINLVIEFVEAKFINCILKDKHGNKLEYIIPHKGNSLGKIFGVMESNKFGYSIADYSVSQTTLDQVFINFAKSKRERDSDEDYEDDELDESENDSELGDKDLNNDESNQQIRVNLPPLDKNDNTKFDSIKNHFNSLKKSKHIRKTSSAKSQHRRQSTRSRKSQKSTRNSISNGDTGFTNLAYEIEFKNSDACEFRLQDTSNDNNNSFNEDGDYFSKC